MHDTCISSTRKSLNAECSPWYAVTAVGESGAAPRDPAPAAAAEDDDDISLGRAVGREERMTGPGEETLTRKLAPQRASAEKGMRARARGAKL